MKVNAVKTVTSYMLELDEYEASVLHAVTRHIGGSPNGPRAVIDGLLKALGDAQVPCCKVRWVNGNKIEAK